jgi:glutathione S-transferase
MLKLYCFDRSPFGWKVRLVLAEKGVAYESIVPQNKAEDPAFGKLNPFRLTPVLVLEDGRTIYESTVVNEYLEDAYPSPAMLPKDPYERARVRMIEDTTDQYVYPAIRAFLTGQFDMEPPKLIRKKPEAVDHAALEQTRAKVHEHLHRLESELGNRTWYGGDVFSLADANLAAPITGTLAIIGVLPDASTYPKLGAWAQRLKARASYAASAPKEPLRIVEA